MNKYLVLIVGMMMVTYIPRLLPFIIVSNKKLPKRIGKALSFIPYTALGALIIPDVFYVTPKVPMASWCGMGFAMVYGWHKGGVIIPVVGSIFITFIVYLIQTS